MITCGKSDDDFSLIPLWVVMERIRVTEFSNHFITDGFITK